MMSAEVTGTGERKKEYRRDSGSKRKKIEREKDKEGSEKNKEREEKKEERWNTACGGGKQGRAYIHIWLVFVG